MKKSLDGWTVDLNRSNLPTIHINANYAEDIQIKSRTDEASEYTAQAIASARWLKRAVAKRNSTTLKVGSEIIRRQTAFLEKGLDYLKPLSLKDIAEEVKMHESTISRVTNNKYIATPRGMLELKYFFTSSIASAGGGDAFSAEAVKFKIKSLINEEPASKILSDDRIVELLKSHGIDIARRTVAKYRDALKIPSSVQRRRQKLL